MKLHIFVSSTCFDLKALREHLRSGITTLGHEPVLSDFDSFPVAPDLSTIENCRKVVREVADIFCLVVGGRYGYVDPKHGRSVVNLEYLEAKKKCIDCIIFVDRRVWDLSLVYSKNPSGNYSDFVDSPAVFTFLNEIKNTNRWIFQFDKTEEIITILSRQLSIRFQDLLTRSRSGRLDIPTEYVGQSAAVLDLITVRPQFWEFLLTSEILKSGFLSISGRFVELNQGLIVRRTRFLGARDSFNHIQSLISDFSAMITAMSNIVNVEIPKGWGPVGSPGDPILIKKACDKIYALVLSMFEWELDLRFVRPVDDFSELFRLMQGWTLEIFAELQKIPQEIDRIMAMPNPSGTLKIELNVSSPKNLHEVSRQFEKMQSDPELMLRIYTNG